MIRAFIAPLIVFYTLLAIAIWQWLTPEMATMANLRPGWIAVIWLRNAALLLTAAGSLHLLLYRSRHQGDRYKFNKRWLAVGSGKFTGRNQTVDNMIWSLASGVTFWTAYESVTWWLYASGRVSVLSWPGDWIAIAFLVAAMVLWSQLHFYLNHRLLHWAPLYRTAHSLHHRNTNTGPWTGISMHPLEHLIYFSAPVLLWVVPAHPVAVLMLLLYSGISPSFSHSGFGRVELFGRLGFEAGDYYHHLHHRYFECNYGNRLVPVDVLFGTYHDGTPEAHERMKARRRADQNG